MSRTLAVLTLAFVAALLAPAAFAQSTVRTGTLEPGDATLDSGEWYDEVEIPVEAGQELVAIVTAVDFDPYLIVIRPDGEQVENDDLESSPDISLVQLFAEEAGTYRVRVTSYESGESGDYALVTAARSGSDAPTTDEEFTLRGAVPEGRTVSLSGELDGDDPVRRDGSWYEAWSLDAEEGSRVLVLLTSPDFDAYLSLVSPSGRAFDDDDGAGGTDSRIELTLDEGGRWIVVANTLQPEMSGSYSLTVERR